jgi:hypothetical protein
VSRVWGQERSSKLIYCDSLQRAEHTLPVVCVQKKPNNYSQRCDKLTGYRYFTRAKKHNIL